MSDKAVYRTAPAEPSLLKIVLIFFFGILMIAWLCSEPWYIQLIKQVHRAVPTRYHHRIKISLPVGECSWSSGFKTKQTVCKSCQCAGHTMHSCCKPSPKRQKKNSWSLVFRQTRVFWKARAWKTAEWDINFKPSVTFPHEEPCTITTQTRFEAPWAP